MTASESPTDRLAPQETNLLELSLHAPTFESLDRRDAEQILRASPSRSPIPSFDHALETAIWAYRDHAVGPLLAYEIAEKGMPTLESERPEVMAAVVASLAMVMTPEDCAALSRHLGAWARNESRCETCLRPTSEHRGQMNCASMELEREARRERELVQADAAARLAPLLDCITSQRKS